MAAAPNDIEIFEEQSKTIEEQSRRAFLAKCGKFAIVTPPAVTLLLHTSMASASGYGSPHGKSSKRKKRRKKKHYYYGGGHKGYGGYKRYGGYKSYGYKGYGGSKYGAD